MRCSRAAALLLLLALLGVPPCLAATLTGRVELTDSRQRATDRSGVVVWLEPVAPQHATPHPAPGRARILQKGKRFIPHVLPVLVGTEVDFPNLDPIFHNAFSTFDGQNFDVGLYPPGTSRAVRFRRPGVVRVFCNIHLTMSAVIVVLNTPHFATSNVAGSFTIPDVPAGEYRLRVFHERATAATLDKLERRVTVREDGPLALPMLAISESGYLPVPHKNKYGRDYPPDAEERGTYSGVPK